MKRFSALMMQTFEKSQRDNTSMLAAGLSFYTMLSLAPALWIVMAAAGAIVGRDSANSAVFSWTSRNIGPNATQYLTSVVDQVNESSGLATIGGAIAMFLGATAAFSALQVSLDRIWHQPEESGATLFAAVKGFALDFLTRQILGFVMMLLMGALLLASMLASAALTFFAESLPASRLLLLPIDFLSSVALAMLLFGTIYHMLHRKAFGKKGLWVGAAVTAVLFTLGKTAIGLYLGSAGARSAYGAAGSFVLLLLWIYYSAQILLFGAEFTEVYGRAQPRR